MQIGRVPNQVATKGRTRSRIGSSFAALPPVRCVVECGCLLPLSGSPIDIHPAPSPRAWNVEQCANPSNGDSVKRLSTSIDLEILKLFEL